MSDYQPRNESAAFQRPYVPNGSTIQPGYRPDTQVGQNMLQNSPPVPPRSFQSNMNQPLCGSNFGYNMMGNPMMWNNGMGFGSRFGMPSITGNSTDGIVTQRLEQHMRPAFESVFSVVQATASIAAVLESSYYAVYSCIRAVAGLADHVGRLGLQGKSLIASLGIIKFIRHWYRRLLDWLGISPVKAEPIWNNVQEQIRRASISSERRPESSSSNLSIFAFLCLVIGGPALIWKLINSYDQSQDEDWASKGGSCFVGRVKYEFTASRADELSVRLGDTIRIAPKEKQCNEQGWLLASLSNKQGVVPAEYVEILGLLDSKTTSVVSNSKCDPMPSQK